MANSLVEEVSKGRVTVLRAGEEQENRDGSFYAPASITLIKELLKGVSSRRGFYTLIDCGGYGEQENIRDLLQQQKIFPAYIAQVLGTHNHPDHIGNLHLFNEADILLPDSRFRVKKPNEFGLVPSSLYRGPGISYQEGIVDESTSLISTPGHSGWDLSVLYKGAKGRIAMVGDLFWSEEDFYKDSEFMGLCVNPEMQKRSRDHIRENLKPEVIVPGHGEAFAPKY